MPINLDSLVISANDQIQLNNGGDYIVTTGKRLSKANVKFFADPAGAPAKITFNTTSTNQPAAIQARAGCDGLVIDNIDFYCNSRAVAVDAVLARNFTFKRLRTQTECLSMFKYRGVTDALIEDCKTMKRCRSYGAYAGSEDGSTTNKNMTFRRFFVPFPSYGAHSIRLHDIEDCLIDACEFHCPPVPGNTGHPLNIRDGDGVTIRNTTATGMYSVFGPLADGDGGINETDPAKRDEMLRRKLKNLIIEGCHFEGAILEAGVENFLIDKSCVNADGTAFRCENTYGPYRTSPEGTIRNCDIDVSGSSPDFSSGNSSQIDIGASVFFNGVLYTG